MEGTGMLNDGPVRQNINTCRQRLAAISACVLALAVGTQMAWTTLLPILNNRDKLSNLTNNEASFAGALCAVGAMIGALPSGIMADKLGRKISLMLLGIPFLLSWIIIYLASHPYMWYIARIIGGIGVGATCVLVPIYISEVADKSRRGTLGTFFQLFLTLGILLVYLFDRIVDYQCLSVICGLVEIIFWTSFCTMPESPEWLLSKERRPEAEPIELSQNNSYNRNEQITTEETPNVEETMKVLQNYSYNRNKQITTEETPNAEVTMEVLENNSYNRNEQITATSSRKSFFKTICDIIRTDSSRRAFIYSCGAMIFQQLAGVNAIISNALDIYDESNKANIIVSSIQLLGSGIATAALDFGRFNGRKILLILSSGLVAFGVILLAICFEKSNNCKDVNSLNALLLSSLFIFLFGFSIGLGPIPWMLTAELNNIKLKGIVSGIAVIINWFLVYFVKKIFSMINTPVGINITFGFIVIIMIIAIFTFLSLPETKGKTNQEI